MTLLGYVIMENHLHFIAAADDLGKEVGDFKSYTAKQLIALLRRSGADALLEQLEYYKLRHKIDHGRKGASRSRLKVMRCCYRSSNTCTTIQRNVGTSMSRCIGDIQVRGIMPGSRD